MTDDVLNTDNAAPTNTPADASPTDPYAPLLNSITRADGTPKYGTVDSALEALKTSQEHIARIETENETLRGVAGKVDNLEQLLVKMQTPAQDPVTPAVAQTPAQAPVDTDQLNALVAKGIEQHTVQQKAQANRQAFNQALTEKFGDKKGEEFVAALQAKGLTKEVVAQIVENNPQTAISILGLDTQPAVTASPRSTVQHASAPMNVNEVPTQNEGESKKDFFARVAAYYRS